MENKEERTINIAEAELRETQHLLDLPILGVSGSVKAHEGAVQPAGKLHGQQVDTVATGGGKLFSSLDHHVLLLLVLKAPSNWYLLPRGLPQLRQLGDPGLPDVQPQVSCGLAYVDGDGHSARVPVFLHQRLHLQVVVDWIDVFWQPEVFPFSTFIFTGRADVRVLGRQG